MLNKFYVNQENIIYPFFALLCIFTSTSNNYTRILYSRLYFRFSKVVSFQLGVILPMKKQIGKWFGSSFFRPGEGPINVRGWAPCRYVSTINEKRKSRPLGGDYRR